METPASLIRHGSPGLVTPDTNHYVPLSTASVRPIVCPEDLVQGLNDWFNVPITVRLTFVAFNEVIEQQGKWLRGLEKMLEGKSSLQEVGRQGRSLKVLDQVLTTKCTWDEVMPVLQRKADADSVDDKLDKLFALLERKADKSDVEAALERRPLRTEMDEELVRCAEVKEVRTWLAAKPDTSEVEALLHRQDAALAGRLSAIEKKLDLERDASEKHGRLVEGMRADMEQIEQRVASSFKEVSQGMQKEIERFGETVRNEHAQRLKAVSEVQSSLQQLRASMQGDMDSSSRKVDENLSSMGDTSRSTHALLLRLRPDA
ncbi:hypothetical protein CYMTET_22294 [Cymbomonas tetramitiformis]|uniref:Uncharacterized protein n=1 Tax=Cymbomonas tetramitiformis TaxID=36881 RepID=A0AAE0G071_9CHLO|nr:hypothetical protein CYMTET_22294 [Cymbomonas tetramitiformis]